MLSHKLRSVQRGCGGGFDSYVKTLLHMNGANNSTTFTDESGRTWTASGNAKISTTQYKFGGASGYFDGTGDYISASDSLDWQLDGGSNSNEWTIDFWVRFDNVGSNRGFCGQKVDNNNLWRFLYNTNVGGIQFRQRQSASITIDLSFAWSPSTNTWYHVALVKQGTTGYNCFIDGTQIGTTQTDTTPMANFAASMTIGGIDGFLMLGYVDEFRISKGVARWTSNFTPQACAYS